MTTPRDPDAEDRRPDLAGLSESDGELVDTGHHATDPADEPVMPTVAEAARRRPAPLPQPDVLRYAFYVWLAAGLVGVLGGLWLLIDKQALIDMMIEVNKDPNITDAQIAKGGTTLLWMLLLAQVAFAVLIALFAYKARDGVRRARLMLTIMFLIVAGVQLVFATPLGVAGAAVALVGTVLLYLPRAGAYFAAHADT